MSKSRLLKESVAAVYETDTFGSLLKNTFHPGGLALTRRVAEVASICQNSAVLDIACGKGETSRFLAEQYGCRTIGVDLSSKMISFARNQAKTPGVSIEFVVADAEELPFQEATFDTIVSECSFSLLPNKPAAALEIGRALKPGGRLVITDLIRRGRNDCGSSLVTGSRPLLPCIAGAQSIEEYVDIFGNAGLGHPHIEDHSAALKKVGFQIGMSFGSWEGFLSQLSSEVCLPKTEATAQIRQYETLFAPSRFGYALIAVSKE